MMKNLLINAYNTEMRLVPCVVDMEKHGVPLDPNLPEELKKWEEVFDHGEKYLKATTGEIPGTKKMFLSLREKGLIDESKIELTPKGNPRYGKDQLINIVNDDYLKSILIKRSKLQKVIGTYMKPWTESLEKYGRFYPFYHQVRGEAGYGTRTGRFSSNMQQIPAVLGDEDIPNLRDYIWPEKGHVLLKRDYKSQEIRVTAHYAEGSILKAFQQDPSMDVHDFVQNLILTKTGQSLDRRIVKTISFLKLYGGGPKKLMASLDCTLSDAYDFFDAYDKALPEFKDLADNVEEMVRNGTLLRTWGGRTYDVEKSITTDGRMREFYYKLMNVLIQGSSADMSKLAMLRYYYHPDRMGRILLVVHDEIVITVLEKYKHKEMQLLKWAMEDQKGWDVKMLSDGKEGKTFGHLEEYKI